MNNLQIEALEPRCHLSGTGLITFRNHTLVLRAFEPQCVLTVILDPDGTDVTAAVALPSSPTPQTSSTFALAIVKRIKVFCSNGGNTVEIGSVASSLPVPSSIFGGAGNDTILGGDAKDMIKSGRGNDWIDARGGRNTIFAGGGADMIEFHPADVYHTGAGKSSIASDLAPPSNLV
jgi:hypothetical protein